MQAITVTKVVSLGKTGRKSWKWGHSPEVRHEICCSMHNLFTVITGFPLISSAPKKGTHLTPFWPLDLSILTIWISLTPIIGVAGKCFHFTIFGIEIPVSKQY